jgi:hypothetical protein
MSFFKGLSQIQIQNESKPLIYFGNGQIPNTWTLQKEDLLYDAACIKSLEAFIEEISPAIL